MLKHTFRKRADLEGRVVIHPQGSAPDGYVLGDALDGEQEHGEIVVEGSGDANYMLQVESLRAYADYLEESVEEVEDADPADAGETAAAESVEERKADVAASGSEGQKDANALGDLSDEGAEADDDEDDA